MRISLMDSGIGLSGIEALVAIVVVLFGGVVFKLFRVLIWRPFTFSNAYRKQGIKGSPYHILAGSVPEYKELMRKAHAEPMKEISHDIVPRVMPHYHKWSQIHGSLSLFCVVCTAFNNHTIVQFYKNISKFSEILIFFVLLLLLQQSYHSAICQEYFQIFFDV